MENIIRTDYFIVCSDPLREHYISKGIDKNRIEVIPNSNKPIDVALYEREGILTTSAPFLPRRVIWEADDIEVPVEKEFKSHIKIKQLTDLFFRAEGDATVGGVEVWCDFYFS